MLAMHVHHTSRVFRIFLGSSTRLASTAYVPLLLLICKVLFQGALLFICDAMRLVLLVLCFIAVRPAPAWTFYYGCR